MAAATTPPALGIRQLNKSFSETSVLEDISVEMQKGEFLVLVGPSGCGKSTLLNCIAGLEQVTGGTISIAGRDVTRVPPRDRDIAMVFQSYALYPTMSVADNIGFGMKIRRRPRDEITARTGEVAKLLQIEPLLDRRPSQLSGGQRQRVAMGRALVRDPALFLFDEPLSNLDARLRVEMRAEIRNLHQSTGASIVYVTHDQVEALTLATRIVVLKDGQTQQIGTPEEIYERPANMFVADFMGSPAMNLIPARISGNTLVFEGFAPLHLPAPPAPDGAIVVGLRPEMMHVAGDGAAQLTLAASLVEHAGSDTYAGFRLGGRRITARFPGRVRLNTGDRVPLTIETDRLTWFDPATEARIA